MRKKMEGLFPLSRMASSRGSSGKEGKGLPSQAFNDQRNGNASTPLPAAVALGMGL